MLLVALCFGASAEEAWHDLDWQPVAAGREASAGRFRLRESEAKGKCGEHEFSLYRAGKSPDEPEFSYCARELRYRAQGQELEFLVSGIRIGSDIGGPSGWVFEDVLLKYRGDTWSETAVMAVQGAQPVH